MQLVLAPNLRKQKNKVYLVNNDSSMKCKIIYISVHNSWFPDQTTKKVTFFM